MPSDHPGSKGFLQGRFEKPQPWGGHEEYPDPRAVQGFAETFFVPSILGGTTLVDADLMPQPPALLQLWAWLGWQPVARPRLWLAIGL